MFFDINFLNDKSKRSFSRKIAAVSFILKQKPIFSFVGHVLLSAILRSIVSNHCISLHGRWSSCSPDVNVDDNDTDRTMLYYWVPGIRLFMPYHFLFWPRNVVKIFWFVYIFSVGPELFYNNYISSSSETTWWDWLCLFALISLQFCFFFLFINFYFFCMLLLPKNNNIILVFISVSIAKAANILFRCSFVHSSGSVSTT